MIHRWNISRMVARAAVAAAMVAAVPAVARCGGEGTGGGRGARRITNNTEWHPTRMSVTALNSYNYYVNIAMTTYRGAYVVNSSDAKGTKESITLSNELENLAYSGGIYLGAGGAYGSIIMGRTNFNGIVAWDGQCPNCATGYTSSYQLKWTDNATVVKCSNCGRTYSLETGAILSGNKGDRLMQYIVSYVPNGVLGIGN